MPRLNTAPLLPFPFFLLVLHFCCPSISLNAQTRVSGRTTEALTGQPVAFVHVLPQGSGQGTLTDIDGLFSIFVPRETTHISFSHLAYYQVSHRIANNDTTLNIVLYQRPHQLQEVVVLPGINPAHRIIGNAINNRALNNPMRLSSFSYTSYNKFIATLDRDHYVNLWETTPDTTSLRMMNLLEKRHLFLLESVTERKFRYPAQTNETVLANRVSGLQNPTFTMLATELQPFSFYDNTIQLLQTEYISPISRTALSLYYFSITDTILQPTDTLFAISFKPLPDVRFNALTGMLYINTSRWAIQNVSAQPHRQAISGLDFRIRQKYELTDDHWFPVQLNTDITFMNPAGGSQAIAAPIIMEGRSYLHNIRLNPPLRTADFGPFALNFHPRANQHNEQFWQPLRPDSITAREKNTYHFMDSLSQHINFDRLLNSVEPLLFGEIPMGAISLPINNLYRYNDFEKHRLGIGFKTNNRFSQRMQLQGYYAWATGDRQEKYLAMAKVALWPQRHVWFSIAAENDVSERGGSDINPQVSIFNPMSFRNFYMNKMDYSRHTSARISFRTLFNFLSAEAGIARGKSWWTDDYLFMPNTTGPVSSYHFSELALRMRLAWGETLMNTPLRTITFPARYPVFYLNIARGLPGNQSYQPGYLKIESRLDVNYTIPRWGKQSFIAEAGMISPSTLPWPLLFTARAGNRNYYLASPFSFGTMLMSEFAANRFMALFFQHTFPSLFQLPRYKPELMIIANAGAGWLSNPQQHMAMDARSWQKGYYETGFAINRILPKHWERQFIFGFSPGIEMLYRLGPYTLPTPMHNLTVKLSMVTSF